MNYIINNILPKDFQPSVIAQGSKILSIKFRSVRIIDSYSFIPIALSQFSSAFGIDELKKGFFPHLFNTPENQTYIGAYPDRKFYTPETFSTKKLDEFNTWYNSVKNTEFDFQKEFREYCWSDVFLLAAGCMKFRHVIINLTADIGKPIDPFENSITIASMCHLIYRSSILKKNTLAFIPENGYNSEKNYSYKSTLWITYMAKKHNVDIQHALNKGEKQIGKYFLDGYDPVKGIAYEFHGCYYHGCPKCFTPETFNQVSQTTMRSIYQRHCFRINYIKSHCKQLIEIWECEFDKIGDPLLEEIINSQISLSPLIPRHALFGGRTNALRLYHHIQPNEKIRYYDFTSLYPYVQKYCRYPIGHPTIITENFDTDINKYYGLIKCKIIPPRKLYLPVLPSKINKKLVFTLCRTCAENEQDKCDHSVDERSLTGTWVLLEVQKAVQLGYKVIDIYEIWHWDETEQYDVDKKSGGIFTEYINLFLKGKQESSGFPSGIQSENEKIKYVQDYLNREGINLDINSIENNPAKR